MQLSIIKKKETEQDPASEKMSDSAVLPSISTGTTQSNSVNTAPTAGLSIAHLPVSLAQSISSLAGLAGKSLQTDNDNDGVIRGNSPVTSNTVSLMQAAAASQAALQQQQQSQQQGTTVVNQTDYFRNCNVPNLINKWRRRHTWLFLREGKMFCQVSAPFVYYNIERIPQSAVLPCQNYQGRDRFNLKVTNLAWFRPSI